MSGIGTPSRPRALYLKRMYLWSGHTRADLQILTVEIPKPVMARYSSGAETL